VYYCDELFVEDPNDNPSLHTSLISRDHSFLQKYSAKSGWHFVKFRRGKLRLIVQ